GSTAFLYSDGTMISIGLEDAEHVSAEGYQRSRPTVLNEAGQVIGHSDRYGGSTGQSAFLYDGTTTVNIGLTDAMHTRNDGYRTSTVVALNENGQAAGTSAMFNGGDEQIGQS